jgi:predicted RNA-binding protein with EMAP domain
MNLKITPNTLKKLEQIFDEARYVIRFEKGNFNSGYCILEQKRVVVVNKFLNLEGKINALSEMLPSLDIHKEELSTESLKFYLQITDDLKSGNASFQTEMDI